MSSLNPSSKLYRETLCEHDWMKPHALTDGQGLAERNIVGRCSGGSREEVIIDIDEWIKAEAQIAKANGELNWIRVHQSQARNLLAALGE